MLDADDVKALAIVIQALKPRRGTDELNYLEALHRWRHGRAAVIGNIIPEHYKKAFYAECPTPKDPYTSQKPGPKETSKQTSKEVSKPKVTIQRVAGFDPEEKAFRWTQSNDKKKPSKS